MKRSLFSILRHTLFWLVLWAIPLIVTPNSSLGFHWPWHEWIRLGEVAIVFYLNYFLLIPKLYFTHQRKWFLLSNIILALVLHVPDFVHPPHPFPEPKGMEFRPGMEGRSSEFSPPPDMDRKPHGGPFPFFILSTLTLSLLSAGIAVALRLTERMYEDEKLRQQLETEHLRSELSYLKLQMSPHFLFNTLNNIYSLVGLNPEQAQKSIHHLSKMLRYLLYETNSELVPIQGEVVFLESYVELMNLRLGPHVELKSHFETHDPQAPIAPLLLLSLVENAYKHGVDPAAPSSISIQLLEANGYLDFRTANTNFPKESSDQSGSGIGLVNLAKRLELIYPGKYMYQHSIADGMYHTQLSIQLR